MTFEEKEEFCRKDPSENPSISILSKAIFFSFLEALKMLI